MRILANLANAGVKVAAHGVRGAVAAAGSAKHRDHRRAKHKVGSRLRVLGRLAGDGLASVEPHHGVLPACSRFAATAAGQAAADARTSRGCGSTKRRRGCGSTRRRSGDDGTGVEHRKEKNRFERAAHLGSTSLGLARLARHLLDSGAAQHQELLADRCSKRLANGLSRIGSSRKGDAVLRHKNVRKVQAKTARRAVRFLLVEGCRAHHSRRARQGFAVASDYASKSAATAVTVAAVAGDAAGDAAASTSA